MVVCGLADDEPAVEPFTHFHDRRDVAAHREEEPHYRIRLAGLPTTTASGATSRVTTAPAPT